MNEKTKKKYHKPILLKHGNVSEFTKTAMDDGSDLDGGQQY